MSALSYKLIMKKVRVGILGCANIAKRYAIPALQSLPVVELVAVASRDKKKAEECGGLYNLEAETYDSLIARDDIDVIYSPLPVGLQEEWVLKGAVKGKHFICEKSITYSLESAKRMVDVCSQNSVALYENFVPEFHPQHAKILSLIVEGKIGTPRVWNGVYGFPPFPGGDIRYCADLRGGAINDCGCYTVFMARKIMQQEPVAVTCTTKNYGHSVDIAGSALLEFVNGTALMSFSFDQMYQNTYSVLGSKGIIGTNRAFALPPTLAPVIELVTNDGKENKIEKIEVPAANQFAKSFNFFCNAVADKDTAQYKNMNERIINQAKVLEAMRVSAQEKRRVEL